MARVLSFLIRYFSNYYTLHRSDLAARAEPLDQRLYSLSFSTLQDNKNNTLFIFNRFEEIVITKYVLDLYG